MIETTSAAHLTNINFNELINQNNLEYAQIMPQATIDLYDVDMSTLFMNLVYGFPT